MECSCVARKFPGVDGFLSLTAKACLHGGGGPQVGEVTRLGGVRKEASFTCNLTTPPSWDAHSQDY